MSTMIGARALRRTIYIMSSDVITYSSIAKIIIQAILLIVNGIFLVISLPDVLILVFWFRQHLSLSVEN